MVGGVLFFFRFPKNLTRILIFLKTKKSRVFSVSPLRNPFLVPKRPQIFLRRFAPIRGGFYFSENLSSKKVVGGFYYFEISPDFWEGGFIKGGGYF